MLNSYIGRLLLIYGITLILVMGTAYSFYDEWLEPQVTKLETIVLSECETCSYSPLFQKQGLSALTIVLDARTAKTGLSYAIFNSDYVSAGDLKWANRNRDQIKRKAVSERGESLNKMNGEEHTLWRDVNTGIAISSLKLDKNHTLYIEEYLKVKPKLLLSPDNQQVVEDNIRDITTQIVLFGLLMMVLGFIATAFITLKIYQKVRNINKTADHIIKHQDLGQRITHSGGNNEFDHLACNLNKMLNKIEGKVEDIKQMSNNIAHDLRTPLTSLHNQLEQLKLDEPVAVSLTKQVNNIIDTFDSLLRISHLESGNAHLTKQAVDLTPLITDVIDLFRPLAEEKEQRLTMRLELLCVEVDINLLFQALGNLVENAIKYAPKNSNIIISSGERNGEVVVSVQDEGHGIPNDKLEDVIQRFVRLDKTRNSPGNGLGLSMVNAIAEAHQGSFDLKNVAGGLKASIHLP